ncbi:OmpA family protein [Campylobacter ureolyticus]|uniref:OmpA family protein n=1 Tax=Campylobacter ureolyticus TaxID=827 RepID=UPI0022B45931|nr:OmpA family protein [Campylobacter ureolyticus]MCZ6166408.1 OmpA family protein [Campylobacter ureolyticus]MDU5325551.1 OmpA family protein [Campylobacter ureolyticus]MDU7070342.1 OmpA family protein [Campylobacter ureolyticus]
MKIKKEQNDTFWIAYADLMAGLLFVFILLIGGIIVKYVLTQSSLKEKEADFLSTLASLKSQEQKNSELEELNKIFSNRLNELDIETNKLKEKNSFFIVEMESLKKVVDSLKDEKSDLNATLHQIYGDYEKERDLNKDLNNTLNENELKIAYLMEQISSKDASINKILNDLNITKNRIKNLSGISVRVIADIKEKLGNSVSIDPNTGALRLSSSVLFDKGSYALKDEAKESLKNTLSKYFEVLMQNDEIRENLDTIIIEGHTDSDGGYLFNLELSQLRAFSVMEFIVSWNEDERLKKYLLASGRSFMSPVMKDGVEDKDASRRIEIKFVLSNKNTINEIQKILEYEN